MRKELLLSGLALAIVIPSVASAQQTCEQRRTGNKVVGTVVGAGLGALFGNAVAEHGGKPGGTIIGGVAGGVVGNQVAGAGTHCYSQGYYDRDGRWRATASGYYDGNGRWVSTAANGYYDRDGRWVSAAAPGGYYASDGRWVAAAPYADAAGADVAYTGRYGWAGAPYDTRAREDWLETRIREARDTGRLDRDRADAALNELSGIRRRDEQYRDYSNGALTPRERVYIQARLDTLRRNLAI
ncbi:MAG: hypothetical protein ACYC8V_09650 [Caulobacteraceae bacterium]